jgi:hypothetical protein
MENTEDAGWRDKGTLSETRAHLSHKVQNLKAGMCSRTKTGAVPARR